MIKIGFECCNAIKSCQPTGIVFTFLGAVNSISKEKEISSFIFYPWFFDKKYFGFKQKDVRIKYLFVCDKLSEKKFFRWWYDKSLISQIGKQDLHILHSFLGLLPLEKRCKYVITIHDLGYLVNKEWGSHISKIFIERLKRSIKNSDKIIAVSEATKNDILKFFSIKEEKIEVVYWGIDEIFRKIKDEEELEKFRFNKRLPSKFILSVGVFHPRKNPLGIIQAFKILRSKYKIDQELVLIGRDCMNGKIHRFVKNEGLSSIVKYYGYVKREELVYFYNLADVFLFPSFYEGFGLPVLESMRCGCSVVCSDRGGLKEIGGNCAYLVDPDSPSSIARGVYQVVSDRFLKSTLIEKGYKFSKRFSWDNYREKMCSLYREIL